MKSKKIGKVNLKTEVRISNPFETIDRPTERTGVAVVMHWMREIIEKNSLDLGLPNVETGGSDRKFPDIVIYKTRRSRNILCVFEFKPPYFDVFNEEDLKEPARKKAVERQAKYFATSNFRDLILWNTEKVNAGKPEIQQIEQQYHLSQINDLQLLEDAIFKKNIVNKLEKFLKELYEFSTGKKAEQLAVDELLIFHLQNKINLLAYYYQNLIYDQVHKDNQFRKDLVKWFKNQGWSFYIENSDDYIKVARQTAYLLANKIIFYDALQMKRPDKLAPLEIPRSLFRGSQLQHCLQGYFKDVLEIDYETIYTTDFIDEMAFPDSREVVEEIKNLVEILKRYDFSTLGYEIIGRIFERLIPINERHNLGQYFTSPDVVDLILKFCLKNEHDKIIDPSCGAGTFLVRAYQHKKMKNQLMSHKEILNDIWGNDIAKFPAHLATINLAVNDLSGEQNYPNIIQKDFFDLCTTPQQGFELPENVRKVKIKLLNKAEKEILYPRWFDCVIGNPPYTRQEEISDTSGEKSYKEDLINKALTDGNKQIANISKRAGIYSYFFIHGAKFLKNQGHFGFIVSNAWLDVEYGVGLQEFFLKNYKIVAVIESNVERWFEDADINTSIIILEKASGREFKTQRDENLARFVYLFKPLRYFIPAAESIWSQQLERLNKIDKLIKTILAHNEFYQNDDLRIFPKKQSELWEEGFNKEEQKYTGAKWGKYIRAPEIFFKILEKGKTKLVPLKDIADVRRGFTTGANEFFYVEDMTDRIDFSEIKTKIKNLSQYRTLEKIRSDGLKVVKNSKTGTCWLIEDEFLKPVIKSPRECKSIVVNPKNLKFKVLMINKDRNELRSAKVLKYIKWGEIKGFHKRPTCTSRKNWYDLGKWKISKNILAMFEDIRKYSFWNISLAYIDATLYWVYCKDNEKAISGILNSTLFSLWKELIARPPEGLGVLQMKVYDYGNMLIPSIQELKLVREKIEQALDNLSKRKISSVFEEIGANNSKDVSLDKVKLDRRELDKIVMSEILGLTEEEQLGVYRAVIDLVKSRIDKAKSFGKKNKSKKGINIDMIVKDVFKKIGENTLKKFYKEKILVRKDLITKKLPLVKGEIKIKQGLFGWQLIIGRSLLGCRSEDEAKYLKIWLEVDVETIKIPKDENYLSTITGDLQKLKIKIDKIIEEYLSSILDQKIKNQILHQVWQKII